MIHKNKMRNVQIICQKINDIYIDFYQNLNLSLLMYNLKRYLPFLKSVYCIEYFKIFVKKTLTKRFWSY